MKTIYVLCPYNLITGGGEALHQLVYYLKKAHLNAKICYVDIKKRNRKIPADYRVYVKDYVIEKDISDEKGNAVIVPETLIFLLNKYKNVQKYIWWLSVNNNTLNGKEKLKKIIRKISELRIKNIYKLRTFFNYVRNRKYKFNDVDVINLCASYYAYDYVRLHACYMQNVKLFIEPISLFYLKNVCNVEIERQDVVLYNPSKNYEFTRQIIESAEGVKFVALKGYSKEELLELYRTAKVYIDFGTFPGAERIPKEAVINGCVIITGKLGASNFHQDVPIPNEYKIEGEKENIGKIVSKIKKCIEEYDKRKEDFNEYKKTVLCLEKNFEKIIEEIFKNGNKKDL